MKYRIRSMSDIVDYMNNPDYCPATLHEQLKKLATKPTLHSPERAVTLYHEVLRHNHSKEL